MGWSHTYRPKGISNLEWFRKHDGWSDGYELLDVAQVGWNTLYGALKVPKGDVIGIVILMSWSPNSEWNFGTKSMSEDMGPYYYDCPERILDVLTPTDDTASLLWRAKCRQNLEARKAKPKVTAGSIVRFEHPITFGKGWEESTLRFEKGNLFRDVNGFGQRYRVRGWRNLQYEVVG